MEYKHTIMKKHPLRNCWMVWMPEIPHIPPYFGSKRECEKARVHAEQKANEYLKVRQERARI
jgi:hypothetical protein